MTRLHRPGTARARRALRALALAACAAAQAGCLVAAINPFYDDPSITTDDRILGAWQAVDEGLSVTVEKSEWRSYRVTYTYPTEEGQLTAYLFGVEDAVFVDVTPVRGRDLGSFVLPSHRLARLRVEADGLRLQPLSFDWFDRMLAAGTLPGALQASRMGRDRIVLGAASPALARWLATLAPDAPVFGPEIRLTRP